MIQIKQDFEKKGIMRKIAKRKKSVTTCPGLPYALNVHLSSFFK